MHIFVLCKLIGMTQRDQGMTQRDIGMTQRDQVMTQRDQGMTQRDQRMTQRDLGMTQRDPSWLHVYMLCMRYFFKYSVIYHDTSRELQLSFSIMQTISSWWNTMNVLATITELSWNKIYMIHELFAAGWLKRTPLNCN